METIFSFITCFVISNLRNSSQPFKSQTSRKSANFYPLIFVVALNVFSILLRAKHEQAVHVLGKVKGLENILHHNFYLKFRKLLFGKREYSFCLRRQECIYQEEGGTDDDQRRDEAGDAEVHGAPPPRLGVLLHHPLVVVDAFLSDPGQV